MVSSAPFICLQAAVPQDPVRGAILNKEALEAGATIALSQLPEGVQCAHQFSPILPALCLDDRRAGRVSTATLPLPLP